MVAPPATVRRLGTATAGADMGMAQPALRTAPAAARRVASHLLTVFATVAAMSLVLPTFDQVRVADAWHGPFVASLFAAGALAAVAAWARLHAFPTSSRSALLFVAFALLAGVYAPHVLLDSSGVAPEHLVFGPVSRAAFGLALLAALAGVELPQWLRRPKSVAVAAAVLAVTIDVTLHTVWFRDLLHEDPVAMLRTVETVAVGAQAVALATMVAKRRGRRWTLFGAALARATTAMLVSSALFLSTSAWTWRWWLAHLGLLVAAALITSAIVLERSRRGSIAASVDLDAASTLADALLDEYPVGVAAIDRHGSLLAWSRAAREMTGWDEQTAQSRADELVDGRRDLGGRIVGVRTLPAGRAGIAMRVVFLEDVSDQVELEQENLRLDELSAELETALAERNQLIGVVAHELRNPLGALRGFAQALRMRLAARVDDTEELLLQRMEAGAERLLVLVDDLLNLSMLGQDGLVPRLTLDDVDVAGLVERSLELHRAAAEEKGIHLTVDLVRPCRAQADRYKLEQVMDNLISNAVKYSPMGGRVEVGAESVGDVVRLVVSDEGQGIPEDEQELLFRPFATTSAVPTGGEVSTGLGLAIAEGIVRAHGGVILVDSTPGEGATFTVLIPQDGDDGAAQPSSLVRAPEADHDAHR